MVSKVIFIGDPYRGDQAVNVRKIGSLFSPIFRQLGVSVQSHITEINLITDRDIWTPVWKDSLTNYPPVECASLDLSDAAIVGFEVPEAELNYLSGQDIPWVNINIHPLRFLDDLYFEVQTSFAYDASPIEASLGLIDFHVENLKQRYTKRASDKFLKTHLICGQDWIDRSIHFDGEFRQLSDYIFQLDELTRQYDRVLYKPHPAWGSESITTLMTERYKAQLCTNANIYEIFFTEGIDSVSAISSSVLTEAPYFGIESLFLEARAKRYGPAINYRALIENSDFWEAGLLRRESSTGLFKIAPTVPPNHLRRTFSSWGFVTEEAHLVGRVAKIELVATQAEAKAQQAEAKAQHLNEQWIEARNESAQVRAQMQQTLDLLHTAQTQMQHAFDRADKAEAATEQLQQKLQSTTQDLQAVRQELHDVHQSNHHHFTQLEQVRKELHDVHQANHNHWLQVKERDQQLAAMQASKSWRITAPLRWCFGQARRLKAEGLASRLKALVKKTLRKLNHYLLARPALRQQLLRWSRRLGLYSTLKKWRDQLREEQTVAAYTAPPNPTNLDTELAKLTPRARQIYADLKQAIELQKGGH